jgi:hypothetical protein
MSKKTAASAQSDQMNQKNETSFIFALAFRFLVLKEVKSHDLRAAVKTHSLEIREPPQKYWSSMNKATCLYSLYQMK